MAADCEISRLIEAATSSGCTLLEDCRDVPGRKTPCFARKVCRSGHGIAKGLRYLPRNGWQVSYPEYRGALAEALAGLGQFDAALTAVDEAVGRSRPRQCSAQVSVMFLELASHQG